MGVIKIEHIGIAVENLETSGKLYDALLNRLSYKTEVVEREGVKTAFYNLGESKVELLEATKSDSPIAKFIAKRGPGIHHIALEVDDIESEMARLQKEGFELIHESPVPGADNKRICFLHPKSTDGVLLELCQESVD